MAEDKIKDVGFFEGLMHGDCNVKYDDYEKMENDLSKEEIVSYLDSISATVVTLNFAFDLVTGHDIGSAIMKTDGVYRWPGELQYHIEKYGIGIPKDFEEHIRKQLEERKK